ncbi:hypothetical protein BMS3Abin03_00749 [bacterium BMS3Abin03]|nr:hypothetical protein BMS3Abin03_00749 [bacterium BMS3Abin03]
MVVGFSVSASSIFPGFYYTGRLSTDPAGTTITPGVVKAGVDYYVRKFGGSKNRWGDYSGASVDPSDDQTFYVFNEYALSRGTILPYYPTEDGRWGTVFGKIGVSALPVELSSFTYKIVSNGVKLNWVTQTEVNNYGFEVERTSPFPPPYQEGGGEAGGGWEKIGFVEGHGNSNSPKYYSFINEGIKYGKYAYRLKQIDNDGTFEYSDVIEADAGEIPNGFVLEQNYPNPFNPSTSIKFAINKNETVSLKIYNELGEEVTTLFNGNAEAGKIYNLKFNGTDLPSGVYFYRLTTSTHSIIKKMLLLK